MQLTKVLSILSGLVATTAATRYGITANGPSRIISDCQIVHSIWDICQENGCPGRWEVAAHNNLSGGGYHCRKVTSYYRGWTARNGLLSAYINDSNPDLYCWHVLFGVSSPFGFPATYDNVRIDGDDGSWILIEFEHSIVNSCADLH